MSFVLECVINISEGQNDVLISHLRASADRSIIDVHSDAFHNRSVFTLAGDHVMEDAISLTRAAISLIDLREHQGVHPHLGVVDVVPFVPLGDAGLVHPFHLEEAMRARNAFAISVSDELALPCFLYGPERSLPEIRQSGFHKITPDYGPPSADPRTGACCVGARGVLIAYNINADNIDAKVAKLVARSIRSKELRTLALELGPNFQISCNLVDPITLGVEQVFDRVESEITKHGGTVQNAELVGLVPERVLHAINPARWKSLGLSAGATIESRLSVTG